jgi:hypothetical protein
LNVIKAIRKILTEEKIEIAPLHKFINWNQSSPD